MSAADWSGRRLHFIGIGGAGMSGLALVCARLGAEVTGSDRADSSYMERLREAGLNPVVGHDAANLPEGAEVVVSTAIGEENPELALARERGIEPIHRGQLLAELCAVEGKKLIAVAGTHGKTTTTAMIAWALRGIGEDPAFFVGGEVARMGPGEDAANASWGEGDWVVTEADESDGSFLRLEPDIAVVTNLEMEHHSHWKSFERLKGAFAAFVNLSDAAVLPSRTDFQPGQRPDIRSAGEILSGEHSQTPGRTEGFGLSAPGPEELHLPVPGIHNVLNARAALAAISLAGLNVDAAAAELAKFPGVYRRLQPKGSRGPVHIYDDYGHHPTEVRAALSALRELEPSRLVAVFQPHLYSRTKAFGDEFGAALTLADEVVVLDVYPAREEPVGELAGVSGLQIAQAAAERGGGKSVWWLPDRELAQRALADRLDHHRELYGEGTVLVTVGAGDVFKLGEALVEGAPR
ncbi:MAG TPA: UDP-N-acetylmuramate--L-alanine ligase [Solirubrobacterales bacterium]|nr:UDP-N-acetylmuramate--L-alanine ligase [Solirubrobacterales bacterium]